MSAGCKLNVKELLQCGEKHERNCEFYVFFPIFSTLFTGIFLIDFSHDIFLFVPSSQFCFVRVFFFHSIFAKAFMERTEFHF